MHSLRSLLDGRVRRRGLELVTRYLRPGCCRGNDRISTSSWGTPIVRLHMFRDSGRTAYTRPIQCSSMALGRSKAKAPTKGLSTLNSMAFGLAVYASPSSLPPPAQDSLPAAGQALPDGLSTRKVPMKGFKVVLYILFPLLKLTWHNRCNLCRFSAVQNLSGQRDRRALRVTMAWSIWG